MESKINLHLTSSVEQQDLRTAVISAYVYEFMVDTIQQSINQYRNNIDIKTITNTFNEYISEGQNVSFTTIKEWGENKTKAYTDMLKLAKNIDEVLTIKKLITADDLVTSITANITTFLVAISVCDINTKGIDFGQVRVDDKYSNNVIEELKLVDEGQTMCEMMMKELTIIPLDTDKFKNPIIEQKIESVTKISHSIEKKLKSDYTKLHNEIVSLYDKFYALDYSGLTDGEKVEKSRKLLRVVNPHRQLLDKLENQLADANELKRQLINHKNKLKSKQNEQNQEYSQKISEFPTQKDIYENDKRAMDIVYNGYYSQITSAVDKVNVIGEDIANKNDILDKLEYSFKLAVPSEAEVSRYTKMGFKFQELLVKLELAKTQIEDMKNKDFKLAVETAITGLNTLCIIAKDTKDIFLRNSMMMSIFNSVNTMYNFTSSDNEIIESSQVKFITSKLSEYSTLNVAFTNDLLKMRNVGNTTIRDVSILMGKTFTLKSMTEIIDILNVSVEQMNQLFKNLDEEHQKQAQLFTDILAL